MRLQISLAILLSGCVNHLAPPPRPPRVVPNVSGGEARVEGRTRVIVDAQDESALVSGAADDTASAVQAGEVLCATPCVAHMRPGEHRVTVTGRADPLRRAVIDVPVRETPLLVRARLGERRSSTVATPLGWITFGVGTASLAAFGIASMVETDDGFGEALKDDLTATMMGYSVIPIVVGLVMVLADMPTEQPSSTAIYELP